LSLSHITHVIRQFAAMAAKYLPSCAEQAFKAAELGKVEFALVKEEISFT